MELGERSTPENENEVLGLGRKTRVLGKKRILINTEIEQMPPYSGTEPPLKNQHDEENQFSGVEKSPIQALSQDLLVRVISGVDHEDLKNLILMSKAINRSTIIAKEKHFAYSTPRKFPAFRISIDLDDPNNSDDIEPPNAPMQERFSQSRCKRNNHSNISTQLFKSG